MLGAALGFAAIAGLSPILPLFPFMPLAGLMIMSATGVARSQP
jgi:hypothetical protein